MGIDSIFRGLAGVFLFLVYLYSCIVFWLVGFRRIVTLRELVNGSSVDS